MTDHHPTRACLVDERYTLKDLLDLDRLASIFDAFWRATGFTTGLVSYPDQEVLLATGWREICTMFHRAHALSVRACTESNAQLTERWDGSTGPHISLCRNGLVDGAIPVIVQGKQVASLFTGQVLFEKPDRAGFERQADIFGFDREEYLAALDKVPIITPERLAQALTFLSDIAALIAEQCLDRLRLKQEMEARGQEILDRMRAENVLRQNVARLSALIEEINAGVLFEDEEGRVSHVNQAFCDLFGIGRPHQVVGARCADAARVAACLFADPDGFGRGIEERVAGRQGAVGETLPLADGRVFERDHVPVLIDDERHGHLWLYRDVTDRVRAEEELRLNAERMGSLLRLNQMAEAPVEEIAHFALEEAVRLTRSEVGYLAFVNEDESELTMFAWSQAGLQQCGMTDRPVRYWCETTGLWGEVLRQRRPIITNDFAVANPWTKGYPEGHVPIRRHMNLPILVRGRVVAIAGVGNKAQPYDDDDVRPLTLLMEGMWRLLARKEAESQQQATLEALRASEEKYRSLVECSIQGMVLAQDDPLRLVFANQPMEAITGFSPENLVGLDPQQLVNLIHPEDQALFLGNFGRRLVGKEVPPRDDYRIIHRTGEVRWVEIHSQRVEYEGAPAVQAVFMDVTERKRAEAAQSESERRFRDLADLLPQVVYEADAQGILTYSNRQAFESFGYTREDLERGPNVLGMIAPEDRSRAASVVSQILAGQPADGNREYRALRRDGSTFPCTIYSSPIVRDGQTVGLRGILVDISEQKRTEAALRVSLEKYRVLFEAFPLGVTVTDLEGNIREVNRASERLLGLPSGEHVKRTVDGPEWSIVRLDGSPMPPDEYASVRALRENCPVENVEMGIVKGEGETAWISVTAAPIPLEGYGVAIAYSDISARVWAERALRQERDLSQALAAAAAVVSSTLEPDQVLDRLLEQVSRVVPNDAANVMLIEGSDRVRVARSRGYERFGTERFVSTLTVALDDMPKLRQVARSGEPLSIPHVKLEPDWMQVPEHEWIQSYAVAPIRIRGETVGFLNVDSATPGFFSPAHAEMLRAFADHAALALANARLYQEAQRELAERNRLEAQLIQSQKMEAVGRLAGGVAHDFNNHLTAIGGYAELLLMSMDWNDPRRDDAAQICRSVQRSSTLTRQLLAFSRKQIFKPESVDLNELIADTEKMLCRLIGEDVTLITCLDPAIFRIHTDPGQIEQVLMNLATNARDAMPDGGQMRIETDNVEVEEGCERQGVCLAAGCYVLLSVSDDGLGMDGQVLSHAFEPFFTTKEPGKGTGLGLSIAYGIVKQSGGYIFADSEPGQGTRISIYLPATSAPARSLGRPESAAALGRGTETILLVEDDDSVRAFARRVLEESGYVILTAADGEQALAAARAHPGPIHLLLTDMMMPGGLSGRVLAERLTAERAETRVLYMSGYSDDAVLHRGVLGQGVPFLQKPFTAVTLAAKVHELLKHNSERTQ